MTSNHTPAAPPRSLLGLWAHPDDESYLSAGLMDRVLRAGGRVTVVILTDGEAGFAADDPRPVEERRELRRSELRAAMAALGVDDVRFVGLPDGGLADLGEDEPLAAFRAALADVRPDVTVTFGPDGITGHDDHVVASRLATEAWRAQCQHAESLARRGHVARSLEARSTIYGRLLTTCAQCHVTAAEARGERVDQSPA